MMSIGNRSNKSIHIILFCLLLAASLFGMRFSYGSELGDRASTMAPGTWAELSTLNMSTSFLDGGYPSTITGYSDNAVWDPVSKSVLFLGGPHGGPKNFIRYSEASNSWSTLPVFSTRATHGFDHNAIDSAGRTFFHREHNLESVWAFNIPSQTWSRLPDFNAGYVQVAGGLEYFPEMGASGSLVFIQGGYGEVHIYDKAGGGWNKVRSGLAMGNYHNIAEYNPVHRVILFGGGDNSRDLYTIDQNGNIKSLQSAPVDVGIHSTIVTVDPQTGDYLVFANGSKFYVYDVLNDRWTLQSNSVPLFDSPTMSPQVAGIIATPIADHGVNMFVKYSGAKVYLYKHTDSPVLPGDQVAPAAPTDLQ